MLRGFPNTLHTEERLFQKEKDFFLLILSVFKKVHSWRLSLKSAFGESAFTHNHERRAGYHFYTNLRWLQDTEEKTHQY